MLLSKRYVGVERLDLDTSSDPRDIDARANADTGVDVTDAGGVANLVILANGIANVLFTDSVCFTYSPFVFADAGCIADLGVLIDAFDAVGIFTDTVSLADTTRAVTNARNGASCVRQTAPPNRRGTFELVCLPLCSSEGKRHS